MKITIHDPRQGRLLLCGAPFAEGRLPATAGLCLRGDDSPRLPLWWQVRSRWPDGSAKWVFLHSRLELAGLPADTDSEALVLQLTVTDSGPAVDTPQTSPETLELDGARLQVARDGCWLWTAAGRTLGLEHTDAVLDGLPPAADRSVDLQLLEASPIAPLLRARGRSDTGVRYDHLLRLEPGGGLHWQQRVSFLTDTVAPLRSLVARLRGDTTGAWRWPDIEPAPKRRLAVLRPGRMRLDDSPEVAGFPEARLESDALCLSMEKGWQRAPFALTVRGDGLDVEWFPDDAEPLPVHPGTSLRHNLRLRLDGTPPLAPARWSLDPEAACTSGAFGPLMAHAPVTARRYPGYEQAMEACLHSGRLSGLEKERGASRGAAADLADEMSQDVEYFGLPHYGDWPMALGAYGGERRMYADNEYDTPYAYWLQFARTGLPEYAEIAIQSAAHMADLDCKADDGDMRFHGYRETADDHGAHRVSRGDFGHYWTDGMLLAWLLRDDIWAHEAARDLALHIADRFAGAGDAPVRRAFLGCERAVGWPLVALAGVAEVDPDPQIVAKMQQMVDYLARFTADPDRELGQAEALGVRWWRICQQDGTKPFMLGVVMEGLERHHRLTGDPAAVTALVAIARFLVEVMWVENVEAFIYEWNAFNRSHREEVYPHYINMMVAPGLAYAFELTGEAVFRDVATRCFHSALWTLLAPGGGKEIGMVGRTSSLMVARLHQWKTAAEQARARRQTPSLGVPFSFGGTAESLHRHPGLRLCAGTPLFDGGSLVSAGDSYAVYACTDVLATDRGRIGLTVVPDWDCPEHPGPVAQRAYLHLCDGSFTQSSVSVISFYTGLHVRFYDAERHYIEVLETDIQTWRAGQAHRVEIEWDGEAGEASLRVDGVNADQRALPRRLSGAFQRLHVGHRPGNWRADARLTDFEIELS